ncbi:hypothetical protein OOZ54_13840 [Rhodopseudomonas palustris]|uniref:hypothetical protein n=1 Tax=Rhodopseudomonas palustris TaxID=1076 RepID=UPI0022F115A7|nr:hypothetical protein [Rhodopseudomonas palustris]WBU27746.1 hypothetical protein OOZ54_13840 [Rhodopseudomonas palustris]
MDLKALLDIALLRACPADEAVRWLVSRRSEAAASPSLMRAENRQQEDTLYSRNDPSVDYALARYGLSEGVAREIHKAGDLATRCTILAYRLGGGFAWFGKTFELAEAAPSTLEELCALATNPTLTDDLYMALLERTPPFDQLDDAGFEMVLVAFSENSRLTTPYDDKLLDGYADYKYHNVFKAAWQLASSMPATPRWASILGHVLGRCIVQSPIDAETIARWRFPVDERDGKDNGYYLRKRLADTWPVDGRLLEHNDPALRASFYERFRPDQIANWWRLADSDPRHFLDAALHNSNLWQTEDTRYSLHRLAWAHPDPHSDMMMPSLYNGMEERMRAVHPSWFAED